MVSLTLNNIAIIYSLIMVNLTIVGLALVNLAMIINLTQLT
jgi:hypothetical protein